MKYTTVKIGDIITRISTETEVKGYTIGVIEIMFPDTEQWSARERNIWILENNKRMEAICKFLNESKL